MTLKVTDEHGTVLTTTADSVTVEGVPGGSPPSPLPPPLTLSSVEAQGPERDAGSSTVPEDTDSQFTAVGFYSDGSQADLPHHEVTWTAQHAQISADGVYSPPDVTGDQQDTVSVVHTATSLSDSIPVTVVDADTAPPVPPPPTPPPPTPPPATGLIFDASWEGHAPADKPGIPGIGGFIWDGQQSGACGGTAHPDGGVTYEPDPDHMQVLRMHQKGGGAINCQGTVKGRFSIPHTGQCWFHSRIKYADNWDAAIASSYKYNFMYITGGATMRLQKCCAGPGAQMSHGYGGGTGYGGTPPLRVGRDNSGWWSGPGTGWVDVFGWFLVESAGAGLENITSGWCIKEIGGGGRHAFWGGKSLNVPALAAGPRRIYRVSQGENINNPPLQDTHIDYAWIRCWDEADPLGLLSEVV